MYFSGCFQGRAGVSESVLSRFKSRSAGGEPEAHTWEQVSRRSHAAGVGAGSSLQWREAVWATLACVRLQLVSGCLSLLGTQLMEPMVRESFSGPPSADCGFNYRREAGVSVGILEGACFITADQTRKQCGVGRAQPRPALAAPLPCRALREPARAFKLVPQLL